MISRHDARAVASLADQCLGPGADTKREARRNFNTAVARLMAASQRGALAGEIEALQTRVHEARVVLRKTMGWATDGPQIQGEPTMTTDSPLPPLDLTPILARADRLAVEVEAARNRDLDISSSYELQLSHRSLARRYVSDVYAMAAEIERLRA